MLGAHQWASGWRLVPERSEKKVGKSKRFTVSCGCSLPCQRWEEKREWSSLMGGTVDKRVKCRTQGVLSSTQEKERKRLSAHDKQRKKSTDKSGSLDHFVVSCVLFGEGERDGVYEMYRWVVFFSYN